MQAGLLRITDLGKKVATSLPLYPPISLKELSEAVKGLRSHILMRTSGSQGECLAARQYSSGLKDQVLGVLKK